MPAHGSRKEEPDEDQEEIDDETLEDIEELERKISEYENRTIESKNRMDKIVFGVIIAVVLEVGIALADGYILWDYEQSTTYEGTVQDVQFYGGGLFDEEKTMIVLDGEILTVDGHPEKIKVGQRARIEIVKVTHLIVQWEDQKLGKYEVI